jgi:hypothetical protein
MQYFENNPKRAWNLAKETSEITQDCNSLATDFTYFFVYLFILLVSSKYIGRGYKALALILTASKQLVYSLLRAEKSHYYPTPCTELWREPLKQKCLMRYFRNIFVFKQIYC